MYVAVWSRDLVPSSTAAFAYARVDNRVMFREMINNGIVGRASS